MRDQGSDTSDKGCSGKRMSDSSHPERESSRVTKEPLKIRPWPPFNSVGVKTTPRGFEPLRAEPNGFLVHLLDRSDTVSVSIWRDRAIPAEVFGRGHMSWLVNSAAWGTCYRILFVHKLRQGLFWELNPGPLAPEARIIPLDQTAS